jgi:hypothetical protein
VLQCASLADHVIDEPDSRRAVRDDKVTASRAWFDIAGEWLFGTAPATELGRAEQEFFAGRHEYDVAVTA